MDETAQVTRWHLVRHAPVVGAGKGALGLLYKTHDDPADTADAPAFRFLSGWLPAGAVLISSGLRRTDATADALGKAALEAKEDRRYPRRVGSRSGNAAADALDGFGSRSESHGNSNKRNGRDGRYGRYGKTLCTLW